MNRTEKASRIRRRENVSLVLFFGALAYAVLYGMNAFFRFGATGAAWLHLVVPAISMSAGLMIWPQPEER